VITQPAGAELVQIVALPRVKRWCRKDMVEPPADLAALSSPVPAEFLRPIAVQLPVHVWKFMRDQAGQHLSLGRVPARGRIFTSRWVAPGTFTDHLPAR